MTVKQLAELWHKQWLPDSDCHFREKAEKIKKKNKQTNKQNKTKKKAINT